MRKLLSIFSFVLIMTLTAFTSIDAASVQPQTITKNDANHKDCSPHKPAETCPTDPTDPCPSNGDSCNVTGIIVIFVLLILAFFLLGLLLGAVYLCPKRYKCKKYPPPKPGLDKDDECNHCKPRKR